MICGLPQKNSLSSPPPSLLLSAFISWLTWPPYCPFLAIAHQKIRYKDGVVFPICCPPFHPSLLSPSSHHFPSFCPISPPLNSRQLISSFPLTCAHVNPLHPSLRLDICPLFNFSVPPVMPIFSPSSLHPHLSDLSILLIYCIDSSIPSSQHPCN